MTLRFNNAKVNKVKRANNSTAKWLLLIMILSNVNSKVIAAESADEALNSCVKQKQIKGAVTGAIFGAFAGLFASSDNNAAGAAIGAAAGSLAGWAYTAYTANNACITEHPEWIPESKLERVGDYKTVLQEESYNPRKDGIKLRVASIDAPATVKSNDKPEIVTTFVVLTPDGSETKVDLTRKLFLTASGQDEKEVPFPGNPRETRTFEPGKIVDKVYPKIYGEPGDKLRYEVALSDGSSVISKMSKDLMVE